MGKSDDLQRLRAEQHARLERETKQREDEAKRQPPPPVEVAPAPPKSAPVAIAPVVVLAPVVLAPIAPAPVALVPVSLDVAAVPPVNEQRDVKKKGGAASAGSSGKKAIATKSKANAETGTAGDETGRCASCGKVKALNRGLVADHQKGLGKSCPGSRKPPA